MGPIRVTPTFDEAVAVRLHVDIGSELEATRKVLDLFLTSSRKLLAEGEAAARAGDAKVVQRVAHTIRSGAGMLGALRLAELCRALEAAATAAPEGNAQGIADLRAEFDRAAPLLEAWAAKLG